MSYESFLDSKGSHGKAQGFDPNWMPSSLFDFQASLVEWALIQGRAAIFADCGLGKTLMQLVWAQNVVEQTNKPVLIVTPLAVSYQTIWEASKFDIEAKQSRDGSMDPSCGIWVTNYEQLPKFNPDQFSGMVCDESSAIKSFATQRRDIVTEFMKRCQYRLLCTATPSPNDYVELGTSSEALGHLGYRDMITMFFKQETSKDHLGWGRTKYRLISHAEEPFWRWVCSWARACRRPSDLGFDDGEFILKPLQENEIIVKSDYVEDGHLFAMPANTMDEMRRERRATLRQRCERAAEQIEAHDGPSLSWCHLNPEADLMEDLVSDAVQVSGSMRDEQKEERLLAFAQGQIQTLVTKPKIGCWGMNFQNCAHQVMFPSDSFEQYYQAVRRSWRFGQTRPVTIDIITTEGGRGVLDNLKRKSAKASRMFEYLSKHMNESIRIGRTVYGDVKEALPRWI